MTARKQLSVLPVGREDWGSIKTLFGPNGACGGCWCMYWRAPSTGKWWDENKGASNRTAFKQLVQSGKASGLLGFVDENPVAWCSVGPRVEFAYLARARNLPSAKDEATWIVTCFFVERKWRKRGVATNMLTAAIDYARNQGGTWLEGYPTTPGNTGRSIPDAFAHTGVPSLFEVVGFKLIAKIGVRNLYRLKL